jgi:homoserine O-succinyltransferase
MNGMDLTAASAHGAAVSRPLTIGLVNNMPPGARRSTERQFAQLLAAAAPDPVARLRCFCAGAGGEVAGYSDIAAVFAADLDAIIVTGAEPRAASLRDEPLWPVITGLVDWAESRAIPAIWSCLAAHVAVSYLDGIDRKPLAGKLSGIFRGEIVAPEDPLMYGLGSAWSIPHSRYNDLPEDALRAAGYDILVRSDEAGLDLFQKRMTAPFLFLQGHPEYDADSLLRELQRDMRRYQSGERRRFPAIPRNYLGPAAELLLHEVQTSMTNTGRMPADVSAKLARLAGDMGPAVWRPASAGLFRNWLAVVANGRERADRTSWVLDGRPAPRDLGLAP